MSFDTPVLLLAWRRPDMTRQVLDAIRLAAPTRLFVACDGPRPDHPGDEAGVRAVQQCIDSAVDWPCRFERLYRDTNFGCGRGPADAIGWFFSQVAEGIVLEDDCVPHPDFFPYCASLLERYRDDNRVWQISGNNYQDGQWRGHGSYYFSRYTHSWGWASWHRAWKHYDADLRRWPAFKESGFINSVFDDRLEAAYWSEIWESLWQNGAPDLWDYQWTFTCLSNGGLSALPNRNLVLNIGFGEEATHTHDAAYYRQPPVAPILPLVHPEFLLRDKAADAYTFANHFRGDELRLRDSRWHKWRQRIHMASRHPLHYPVKLWRRITGSV